MHLSLMHLLAFFQTTYPIQTGTVPLIPEQASEVARQVDYLFYFVIGICILFSLIIFVSVFYLALRYRRKSHDEVPAPIHGSLPLELMWSVGPGLICMVIFAWASVLFFHSANPPAGATEIYVVGKQWMWKLQHPEGQREINELHVPVGRPVKLIMTSEDVVHSFFIPAFRIKQDVVPGRYTTEWFTADKPGTYHLFCSQYCGTEHARMGGFVYVMEPRDYENWLQGGASGNMVETGERLFGRLGCVTCHVSNGTGRGPSLDNVYGKTVELEDGTKLTADEGYIRESILQPQAKVVKGFKPVMPTFQGQVSEEQILQLTAYIKSLSKDAKDVKDTKAADKKDAQAKKTGTPQ